MCRLLPLPEKSKLKMGMTWFKSGFLPLHSLMTMEEVSAIKFTNSLNLEAQKTVQPQRIIRQSFCEDLQLGINVMVESCSEFFC